MSGDGLWVVVLIELTNTDNGRDGAWLRVSHHGIFVGEARDWDGVRRLGVDVGDLGGRASGKADAGRVAGCIASERGHTGCEGEQREGPPCWVAGPRRAPTPGQPRPLLALSCLLQPLVLLRRHCDHLRLYAGCRLTVLVNRSPAEFRRRSQPSCSRGWPRLPCGIRPDGGTVAVLVSAPVAQRPLRGTGHHRQQCGSESRRGCAASRRLAQAAASFCLAQLRGLPGGDIGAVQRTAPRCGAEDAPALSHQTRLGCLRHHWNCLISARRMILPVDVFGRSSTNRTSRGRLYAASDCRAKEISSSSVALLPAARTT
jgi:hypothetical protein